MLLGFIIIAAIFAFLIGRLVSAHFKNKLREQPGDDWTNSEWPAVPDDLKRLHSSPVTDGSQRNHG